MYGQRQDKDVYVPLLAVHGWRSTVTLDRNTQTLKQINLESSNTSDQWEAKLLYCNSPYRGLECVQLETHQIAALKEQVSYGDSY